MAHVRIIPGPSTARLSKVDAEKALLENPSFPRGAAFNIEEVEGRWVAAYVEKTAAPFPIGGGDEPSAPPAEGPSGEAPIDDGASADTSDGEDKPKEDKPEGEGDKKGEPKGEKGEIAQLVQMVTTLLTALGLSPDGAADSPVPGMDEGPPAPPPGAEAVPPHAAPGVGAGEDNKTHTVHERALKPGEAPPGTTPVGAPSFASVSNDHPWFEVLGKKRTFQLEEPMGSDERLSNVRAEIQRLAHGTGYGISQLYEDTVNGQRVAKVLMQAVSAPQQ